MNEHKHAEVQSAPSHIAPVPVPALTASAAPDRELEAAKDDATGIEELEFDDIQLIESKVFA